MYPCKNCLVKTICSEDCYEKKRLEIEDIAKGIKRNNLCPFCGTRLYRSPLNCSGYGCNTCDSIFSIYGSHASYGKNGKISRVGLIVSV